MRFRLYFLVPEEYLIYCWLHFGSQGSNYCPVHFNEACLNKFICFPPGGYTCMGYKPVQPYDLFFLRLLFFTGFPFPAIRRKRTPPSSRT